MSTETVEIVDCGATHVWATYPNGAAITCTLPTGHSGTHEDRTGALPGITAWSDPDTGHTIKAVTADVARSLADRWDTKADEYVRNMPNGEMVNGIATALHQCAKELQGLCDLAVTVTLSNGEGS